MEKFPLLTFNKPKLVGSLGKLPKFNPPKLVKPTYSSQLERHAQAFKKIESFSEHMTIENSIDGLMPEKVLVLQIVGSVQNFVKAINRVPGFEFLKSSIDDEFEDPAIYAVDTKGEKRSIPSTMYLTMSNQAGLKKLLSYWKAWKKDKKPPIGLTPLKHVFLCLSDLRFWETKDRLKTTYLLDDWKERLEWGKNELIPFEIELWFRNEVAARAAAENRIVKILEECGGKLINKFVHEGIRYHGLLGELPREAVSSVLKNIESVSLMRCDDTMFFRPIGQCISLPHPNDSIENESISFDETLGFDDYAVDDVPVIALFDGLPLENHDSLKGRLIVDDPDGFEDFYESDLQIHGTSMASLILHGDIVEQAKTSLQRKLYVRPIMAPTGALGDSNRYERIPEHALPLDIVHRAVVRMFDGENGLPPQAPTVKVINLSIGDRARRFDTDMSSWARMIDWLSFKYKVLFVISAGNIDDNIELNDVTLDAFERMSDHDRERVILEAIYSERSGRRMMSPSEAINALSVRANHKDNYDGMIHSSLIDPL